VKIALDEHIPATVLDAVNQLLEDDRHGSIEVVRAKDYVEAPSGSDTPWLRKFALDGGTVVITADRRMRSRLHERKALLDLGLIVFFAPSTWNRMKFMHQAAYLLRWWDTIIECAKNSPRSICWQLPHIWNPSVDKIINVTGPKEKN